MFSSAMRRGRWPKSLTRFRRKTAFRSTSGVGKTTTSNLCRKCAPKPKSDRSFRAALPHLRSQNEASWPGRQEIHEVVARRCRPLLSRERRPRIPSDPSTMANTSSDTYLVDNYHRLTHPPRAKSIRTRHRWSPTPTISSPSTAKTGSPCRPYGKTDQSHRERLA